jgi:hypothetical protein
MMAAISAGELETLFIVVALLCLLGAAYLAYVRNVVGAVLLLVVAIVAAFLAS